MKVNHLIYGTFPDLPGSQRVVYKSAGISSQQEARLIGFYDQFGDCKNEEFRCSLSLCWFTGDDDSRLAAITKVSHFGRDFSGRWGALLRHTAVLTGEQYSQLCFDAAAVGERLVSTGTSEELMKSADLEIDITVDIDTYMEGILPLPLDEYRPNLEALMRGESLRAYADTNNDFTDEYLRNLLRLLPHELKKEINWTEFAFRASEEFDIAICYSSRYEAPTSGVIKFAAGESSRLKNLALPQGLRENYIGQLNTALETKDRRTLQALLLGICSEADRPPQAERRNNPLNGNRG